MPLWNKRSREPTLGGAELASTLDDAGFFKWTDADARQRAIDAISRRGIDGLWKLPDDIGRSVAAGDAEDLAEGGVAEFLNELRPHLERRGVRLGSVEDVLAEDGLEYHVRIGGESHEIYDFRDAGVVDPEGAWGRAWVGAFEIGNGLLEHAGSPERAYTLPEWEVWFMTPTQFQLVADAIPEPRYRPYAPVDAPPWYGQTH